ncbi:MAG: virulence factor MviN [Micrococcales bacterium]|nr:virulence factor MviN [Micrococcales bacterium]
MAAREAGRGQTGRAIAIAAGSIALITLVARVVGFGRWFAFSHSVGATCVGSVYQSVNAVPNVLFEIAAGGVLAAVAVPLVAGALGAGRREQADRIASGLLTWSLFVLVPLAVIVVLAAEPITRVLLGTGTNCSDAVALGVDLLRMFAIQIPLYGVGIVLAGVLQAHRRFVGAALAPLLSSLVVIVTYVLYRALVLDPAAPISSIPSSAVLVLGLGTTIGVLALSLPLLVPARRAGLRWRPALTFPDGVAARVRRLAVAGLLVVGGQQVATLVIIRLANDRGGAGTLNVHTYVQAIALLPYAVLAVPLATAAFPTLAGQAEAGAVRQPATGAGTDADTGTDTGAGLGAAAGVSEAHATLRGTWLTTLLAGLFSAALLVAVARPVGAFFESFDAGRDEPSGAAALAAIPATLVAWAPGVVGLCAIGLLSRVSYVRGRARAAGLAVALGWLATTVIPIVALPGAAGPARTLRTIGIGVSVGLLLGAGALLVLVARAWGADTVRVAPRPLLAGIVGALAAGGLGWWLGGVWDPEGALAAALASVGTALAAIVAFVIASAAIDRSTARRVLTWWSAGRFSAPTKEQP